MAQPLITNSEKGQELFRYLSDALSLPKNVTKLSVHMEIDDLVRVDCSFIATEPTVLTEADADADLAGLPRPDNGL